MRFGFHNRRAATEGKGSHSVVECSMQVNEREGKLVGSEGM